MIEVGEYVRTDIGVIYKYTEEEKDDLQLKDFRFYNDGRIVKHSKNIIDLIEEDDIGIMNYNGMIFRKFITLDDILELKVGHYKLLRLVTKEQYKSVEYIVKEEQ